jgi:hypothetical protein
MESSTKYGCLVMARRSEILVLSHDKIFNQLNAGGDFANTTIIAMPAPVTFIQIEGDYVFIGTKQTFQRVSLTDLIQGKLSDVLDLKLEN